MMPPEGMALTKFIFVIIYDVSNQEEYGYDLENIRD